MNPAGTDAARLTDNSEARLRANLDALQTTLPRTAKLIEDAAAPESLVPAVGRDGAATFAWTDSMGRKRWLGDTTMPSVSEPALIEQFDVGGGNVILSGIGQGMAIRSIEKTHRAHQTTFVVEPESWRCAAVFRLHEFGAMIRSRRLLLFTGTNAWDHLIEHLVEFPGYLAPERSLAWPWFSRADVRALAERITTMQARVAERRLEAMSATPDDRATPSLRILFASNSPDARAHRWARELERAARTADAGVLCCVPDDPAMMHPAAIDRRVMQLQPTLSVLIDCAPAQLAYRVGDGRIVIVITHANPLTDDLLRQAPREAFLLVRSRQQRDAAIAFGWNAARVARILPGVSPESRPDAARFDGRFHVVALCDWRGTAPEDVGLHLGSHQRLWQSARDWIAHRVDGYHDGLAAEALAHAEQSLDIHIQSDEVRAGLASRIASTLGGQVVAQALLMRLAEAGVELDLRGTGWEKHATLSRFAAIDAAGAEIGAMVSTEGVASVLLWMETSSLVDDRVLAWLSMGRPVWLRHVAGMRNATGSEDGWHRVIDCDRHVTVFATTDELLGSLDAFRRDPSAQIERSMAAAAHLKARHSWNVRLAELLALCGMHSESAEDGQ